MHGGAPNEYYQGAYQESGYAGAHPPARPQDAQQQHPKQIQQQPLSHQQLPPQHQQQQQQHQQQHSQQYGSYPPHAGSGYMRSSVSEVDRSRSHSVSAQQQPQSQQHYGYPPQSAPQSQQPQHALMTPLPRGSIQDIHAGSARSSTSGQHQQHPIHHTQERPQPENDEALVMNFMSELQMRQQQQQPQQQHPHQVQHSQVQAQPTHKQPRKAASSPQVPQSAPQMASQQVYNQHAQHQHVQHPQPHHALPIQQQQQQQQSMHMDHQELQPHSRYVHNEHHGYPQSHEPLPTSPAYRPQPSSAPPPVTELPRPMTPPGLVSPGVHPRSQGAMVDNRQRPIPGSGILPGSPSQMAPHPGMLPIEPAKNLHGPSTPTGPIPPRSASLMNILNIPEREHRSRHAEVEARGEMEDVQPTPTHVTQDRVSVEPSIHHAYRHDSGQREDYPPGFSETTRETHREENFSETERPIQETLAEPDSIEEHASAPVVAPKTGKEKVGRSVKEKVVKEKPVKPAKEKVEKVKKERVLKGGKKKLSTTATIGVESDDTGMDVVMEQEQLPAEPRPKEPRPQELRPQELLPQESRPQEARPHEPRPQESRPQESRPQESRPQEAHPQESRPQEPRPQESRSQEASPLESRQQEQHLSQEPHPQELRPQESHPQESRVQESIGVFKHTLELPGGGRIELPSKKSRMETFSASASGGNVQLKVARGSDVRRTQEGIDRPFVDRSSAQAHPGEFPKQTHVATKDFPAESRNALSKLDSPKLPFPVSLPPAESTKTPRAEDVSSRQASAAKSTSTLARSRSSSPPPPLSSSSSRGHTGLGVELPESHVNGSLGSGKKSQQDGDRENERIKVITSKEASKNSKTYSGGSSTPKEKKSSKKEAVPDRLQDDDVVIPQKASKSSESKKSHDIDDDMPSPKPSKTQSSSKKGSSSAHSQSSSFKKRFSRPAETEEGHLGSTGSKVQEGTHDSISGHDRTTSSESSRGKSKSHSSSNTTKIETEQSLPAKAQKNNSSSGAQLTAKEEDVEMEEPAARGEGLYCICRTVYDPSRFMIACDGCDDWFHGDCVGVAEKDSDMVDKYYCKRCEEKGRHGSLKKKCFREGCQKTAGRKSKYCSKECGLLVATQRIQESQERVFGDELSNQSNLPPGQVVQQQHLQRRRRLTLADLDDRQRLLGIREKMAHVRKVCTILEERSMQLDICVDRQVRQDLGKLDLSMVAGLIASSSPTTGNGGGNGESKLSGGADMDDEDEGVLRTGSQSKSKTTKTKAQRDRAAAKDKDKDALCGFDYSLVWDDAQDISRKDRAALSSLVSTPIGSRASSVAPPSFGVVVVNPKRHHNGAARSSDSRSKVDDSIHEGEGGAQISSASSGDAAAGAKTLASSPYLVAIGQRVCTSRRNCDRHNGWQKLKAAELELEQSKLLKTLKAEAKLVKSRMKRRRNDLSARILNGTIEH
ncbi:hypothetical protein EC991_007433 [Linnemannia zychae]|nr:hypothetical protein EC991_007433 [Linnemannia zychae]